MKQLSITFYLVMMAMLGYSQPPCAFDELYNKKGLQEIERTIQAEVANIQEHSSERAPWDSIRYIPTVVHIIHNGGSENISDAQVASQIQIMNEDYGKILGTNGDGNGVDTKVRFCLAKIDPNDNCTNGIVRIQSTLTNHQTYQRAFLKQLSFWDNTRYMNIYIVKTINGGVLGYSSFPGGPPDEDGMVVKHNVFGNVGTASSSLGRTASHEIGHWFGLYHTFNNGCGIDVCSDGDYVCDTPPQASPSYNCNTLNTCSLDVPDVDDQKENYMNYTPDACKDMFTEGQKLRINATLNTIRTTIWEENNLISTGCDTNYVTPATCPAKADFVTLTPDVCIGNSIYFSDRSLNNPNAWQWSFPGGDPSSSNEQNPTITYGSTGSYPVTLIVTDSLGSDTLAINNYITVSNPGIGDALYYSENFDLGLYPPTGVTINNMDGGITWELDSLASTSGQYSIKINNLINTNYGSSDEIILPYFDLSSAHPDSNVFMTFNWAYAKSDPSFSDELLVLLSTDCGTNFTQVFYKTQNALTTGPTQTTPFVPDSSQWKNAKISLNNYRDKTYVQIKIVNVTDGGNNLYIDDIYVGDGIGAATSVNDIYTSIRSLSVYPNPTYENTTLEYSLTESAEVEVSIYNLQGQLLRSISAGNQSQGQHRMALSTIGISQGVYLVKIRANNSAQYSRLTIIIN